MIQKNDSTTARWHERTKERWGDNARVRFCKTTGFYFRALYVLYGSIFFEPHRKIGHIGGTHRKKTFKGQ
jgi:hypothetical protein